MKGILAAVFCVVVIQISAVPMEADSSGSQRTARRASCGGSYPSNSGVIVSPNYPRNYNNSMDCQYSISPQYLYGTYEIRFYVCDLSIETSVFGGCADYLAFNTTDKLCGTKTPTYRKFDASGTFRLKFRSDWRNTRRGFKMSYCINCYNWNALSDMC